MIAAAIACQCVDALPLTPYEWRVMGEWAIAQGDSPAWGKGHG